MSASTLDTLYDEALEDGQDVFITPKGIGPMKAAIQCDQDVTSITAIKLRDGQLYKLEGTAVDDLTEQELGHLVHRYILVKGVNDWGENFLFYLKIANNSASKTRKQAIKKAQQCWVRFQSINKYDIEAVEATDVKQDAEFIDIPLSQIIEVVFADHTITGKDSPGFDEVLRHFKPAPRPKPKRKFPKKA